MSRSASEPLPSATRGTFVNRAPQPHQCQPDWRPGDDWNDATPNPGDIWRCNKCGQHWQYTKKPWWKNPLISEREEWQPTTWRA